MSELFEKFLRETKGDPGSEIWRPHVIAVADTMYVCKKWFDDRPELEAKAADIVAMARLVIERESLEQIDKTLIIISSSLDGIAEELDKK